MNDTKRPDAAPPKGELTPTGKPGQFILDPTPEQAERLRVVTTPLPSDAAALARLLQEFYEGKQPFVGEPRRKHAEAAEYVLQRPPYRASPPSDAAQKPHTWQPEWRLWERIQTALLAVVPFLDDADHDLRREVADLNAVLPNLRDPARCVECDGELPEHPVAFCETCAPVPIPEDLHEYVPLCRAGKDGDCTWEHCPQNRDGESARSGRHCPIDLRCDDCGESPWKCRCPKQADAPGGPTRLQILEAQRELTAADVAWPFEDGTFSLLLNDTFNYASADAEGIPDAEVVWVAQLYKDHGWDALCVWAEDKRGDKVIKPLQKAVNKMRDRLKGDTEGGTDGV